MGNVTFLSLMRQTNELKTLNLPADDTVVHIYIIGLVLHSVANRYCAVPTRDNYTCMIYFNHIINLLVPGT